MKVAILAAFLSVISISGAEHSEPNRRAMAFLERAVERLERHSVADFKDASAREKRRAEALEMFGLLPMPERGDLKATITGKLETESFVVEKLHFQSSPGLYVTANLYLPKKVEKPLPAVLYVCGHANMITNGVSFGNKSGYQHHGAWFARNGYVCLMIDTVQLGEIRGLHHGTYRDDMWWWNSRGYSPAAVEAWNSIRAIDYLETRSEVDKTKVGVTGRSGGGAYSWSMIALDSRVTTAAPVAGITDLRNHVIDGAVEGHCDCMYFVNTYGWDYSELAACAAPKPLLIVNTDSDRIFPLDGVTRLHKKVAGLYRVNGNTNDLGLVIGPGPHLDTQDLQMPVFRWFNKHLRGTNAVIEMAAIKFFTPQELRVFEKLPKDQRNTTVQEWFIPKAAPGPKIRDAEEWKAQREVWMSGLKNKVFRNWPEVSEAEIVPMERTGAKWKITGPSRAIDGPTNVVKQLRRRFMLVGTTIDSMRVFDLVQALERSPEKVEMEAEGDMAVNALFASLFTDKVKSLKLKGLPESLEKGPDYLNVLRVLDIREALALAKEHAKVEVIESNVDANYANELGQALGWKN